MSTNLNLSLLRERDTIQISSGTELSRLRSAHWASVHLMITRLSEVHFIHNWVPQTLHGLAFSQTRWRCHQFDAWGSILSDFGLQPKISVAPLSHLILQELVFTWLYGLHEDLTTKRLMLPFWDRTFPFSCRVRFAPFSNLRDLSFYYCFFCILCA